MAFECNEPQVGQTVLNGARTVRQFAQFVRHAPVINQAEWLWTIARKPYHRLLNIRNRGVSVLVGNAVAVRMPPDSAHQQWESFEPAAVGRFASWVRENPGGCVLDVGCSVGIYSAVALFEGNVEIVAIDSDIASLAATKWLCQYGEPSRLHLVYGLVSNDVSGDKSLNAAIERTAKLLAGSKANRDHARFICLGDPETDDIPRTSIDQLVCDSEKSQRKILIKCDVEGAELQVLTGAKETLQRFHPDLLVSVHPTLMSKYRHSKSDLQRFLYDFGYKISCIAIDYEEHWWCAAN